MALGESGVDWVACVCVWIESAVRVEGWGMEYVYWYVLELYSRGLCFGLAVLAGGELGYSSRLCSGGFAINGIGLNNGCRGSWMRMELQRAMGGFTI